MDQLMSASPGPVIVIDDDVAVRNSLKFALQLEGLDVRVYPGADEVLAEHDWPDRGCLVVDYQMPRMNGVELVDCLRKRSVHLPAILITGKANGAVRSSAECSGFRQVLEKPLDDDALLDSIRSALSRKG
jgi:two-component system, LuxR family, response regulator FixJ